VEKSGIVTKSGRSVPPAARRPSAVFPKNTVNGEPDVSVVMLSSCHPDVTRFPSGLQKMNPVERQILKQTQRGKRDETSKVDGPLSSSGLEGILRRSLNNRPGVARNPAEHRTRVIN